MKTALYRLRIWLLTKLDGVPKDKHEAALHSLRCYDRLLAEPAWKGEWKVRKDGKGRYRPVKAHRIQEYWYSEKEWFKQEKMIILPAPWTPTDQDYHNGVTDNQGEWFPDYGDHPWDQIEDYEKSVM
jgi:hypothetical protein